VPTLYAELQIAGRQVACDHVSFSFTQTTDDKGRPTSVVRMGLLQVTITGEAAGWSIWEKIKFNPYRRESGHLVFFKNEGITAKRYTFYDAALVELQFHYDGKGTAGKQTATQVELHFSAATIELDGIRLEAHSVLPWETDPQTSFRALTQPPAPSPHLAVGAGLVAAARVAEKVAEKIPVRIPWLELAQTATLLPALLLTSVNADADPAKDRDWQMYKRNSTHPTIPLPPPPDKVRLAQLERALAAQTLTAQEEAELIMLLAKVKGIFVNQLADLTPTQRTAVRPPVLDPTKKPLYAPVIKKWHDKGGTIETLTNGDWKYTDWQGNSVVYEGDFPNFDSYKRQQTDIPNMIGDHEHDFKAANQLAPLGKNLEDNTWHHHQNLRTMQEVPREIHARFTHYGACSIIKKQGKKPQATPARSKINRKKP
jgi:hypothetical protein